MTPPLQEYVTLLLARYDPAHLLTENPELSSDEYEFEAKEIVAKIQSESALTERGVMEIIHVVFARELGLEIVSRERLRQVAKDLTMRLGGAPPE
jgi:hypothetical protein